MGAPLDNPEDESSEDSSAAPKSLMKKVKSGAEDSKASGGFFGGLSAGAKQGAGMAKQFGLPTFKHGGKVKKTGLAKVDEGERVLTKSQTKKFDKKSLGRKLGK